MKDEFDFIKLIMGIVFIIVACATMIAYATDPATKESIAEAQAEAKQQKAEERFFMPDINTGKGAIIVDRETGVCYYWRKSMNAGGMTVLVDADGKPVIWEVNHEDEE